MNRALTALQQVQEPRPPGSMGQGWFSRELDGNKDVKDDERCVTWTTAANGIQDGKTAEIQRSTALRKKGVMCP